MAVSPQGFLLDRNELDVVELGPFVLIGLADQGDSVTLVHADVFEDTPAPAVDVFIQLKGGPFFSGNEQRYPAVAIFLIEIGEPVAVVSTPHSSTSSSLKGA